MPYTMGCDSGGVRGGRKIPHQSFTEIKVGRLARRKLDASPIDSRSEQTCAGAGCAGVRERGHGSGRPLGPGALACHAGLGARAELLAGARNKSQNRAACVRASARMRWPASQTLCQPKTSSYCTHSFYR